MNRCGVLLAIAAALTVSTAVEAQFVPGSGITLAGGQRIYDGGSTIAASLRTDFAVSQAFRVEIAGSVADPVGETSRSASSLLEAQLQVPLPLGEVLTPYVGAGAGLARTATFGARDGDGTDFVVSAGIGVRAALSRELGIVGDVRVRAIGTEFEGEHVDLTLGLRYQFR